jgi:hypothetical protein
MTTDAHGERSSHKRTCEICGHEWCSHDPEDGQCDSPGPGTTGVCLCGRNLPWMQRRIAALSRRELSKR